MIDINHIGNKIRFDFGYLSKCIPQNEFPLTLKIHNYINNNVIWETEIFDNYFAVYDHLFYHYVKIYTNSGILIYSYNISPHKNDKLNQFFYFWCSTNPNTKGLAIGTHDGMFGEWVQSVVENRTKAVLVEGSEIQFKNLENNFKFKDNVTTINTIVTPKGGKIEFYEVDNNYGNSIYKDKLLKLSDGYEIKTTIKDSTSIYKLITNNFESSPNWIHLDVEGLDGKLILEFQNFKHLLPNFFIFENNNLDIIEFNQVLEFLKKENYNIINEDINTLAYR